MIECDLCGLCHTNRATTADGFCVGCQQHHDLQRKTFKAFQEAQADVKRNGDLMVAHFNDAQRAKAEAERLTTQLSLALELLKPLCTCDPRGIFVIHGGDCPIARVIEAKP